MSFIPNEEFYAEVAKGNVPKHSLIHKFGAHTITTTLEPVALSGTYPTPTTATALEFVSDSANDTSTGSGAREVTVIGLDASWNEVSQTVTTNGTTAVALGTNLIRLYRWYVSSSGSYATDTAGSHDGELTIRVSGAGATWSTISNTVFATGQSQIGCYTVPTGYTGHLLSKSVFVDSSKSADVYFFQRPGADDVTTPYSGNMRLFEREVGVSGGFTMRTVAPKSSFIGPCDVGFMAKISVGNAECSVEFELLLVQD